MPDTRVHFYASDDAQELTGFKLSPAVHPLVMKDSLEKKRQSIIVQGMRRLILREKNGQDIWQNILGKVETKSGTPRVLEAFDIMSQASFRGRFFGPNMLEVVVVDDKEMPLAMSSVDILSSVEFPKDSVQGELIKHGIITGQGRNAIHEGKIHISTTLSPAFVDGTQEIKSVLHFDEPMRKTVGGIIERTQAALETQVPTDADWSRALLACPEEHFLANLAIFYQQDNQPSPKKSLYKLGDAVLLRYHQINMEGYRGTHPRNNHWLDPDKLPLCLVCKKDMPGSQNFARLHGNSLHVSCVPQHVADNRWDDGFEMLVRLHNAMFPNSTPVNIPQSAQ